MQIALGKPEIEQFISEQVSAGNYPSAEAVVEAAIAELRHSQSIVLDDETVDAINEAEAEGDRGEGMELSDYREQFRNRVNRA